MRWIVRLFQKREAEAQLEKELRFHVEQRAADLMASGMEPEEARRRARLEFGGVEQIKEACRESRAGHFLETLAQDVRYGLRMLRKSPGFTAVAVLTLALGIGANTAIFSVVDAVLFRSLPYPDANRLVVLNEEMPRSGQMNVSLADFFDWQAQNRSFEEMAAYSPNSVTLTGAGDPIVVHAGFVSWSFFPLLGAKPFLGRTFSQAEDRPGAPWAGVVISYSLWRNKLKGDPGIVGKSITLDGEAGKVIGVLPPGFQYPGLSADVYNQMGPLAALPGYADRANHPGIQVLARLRPGVSLAAARADMSTIMARLGMQYPKSNHGEQAHIVPLYQKFLGMVEPVLLILFAAAGFVLLLACVNVAGLFLGRATTRQRELALRRALGATGVRLLRQLLTESVLLSLFGGAAGSLLGYWAMKPLLRLAPEGIPNVAGIHLDSSVLLFTVAVSAFTGVLFGLLPGLQAACLDVNTSLKKDASVHSGRSGQRIRSTLFVAEIAVALVVVTGAGLLIRSLTGILAIDPGFNPGHVLAMDVILNHPNSDPYSFYNEALRRIHSLPGVQSAAAVMQPPIAGLHWTSPYMVEGRPAPAPSERPWTAINMVTPDYFRTMQTPLLEGRFFTDADSGKAPLVVIINKTLARRLWPNESAIGKRINALEAWREVVGVVPDVKQFALFEPAWPETFVPFDQMPIGFMTIVVRTPLDPLSLAHPVTAVIHGIDPVLAVSHVVPLTEYVAASVQSQRFSASLFGGFGILALALAAIGVYGTMAYNVARRTHEIGIRMALGAQRGSVMRMVLRQSLVLVAIGLAIGIGGAIGLTRYIASELYGVTATDPATFTAVALLLTAVALLACWIPARRAMRVDPMVALRHE